MRMKISLIILITGIIWSSQINIVLAQNNSLGRELYIENCSSCHVPIPAQVLPTQSWQEILNNTQNHYGVALPTSVRVTASLIWTYLEEYSRPIDSEEVVPQYVTNSRYLRALHPQVELPQPSSHQTCTTCHPLATKLDYRTLSDVSEKTPSLKEG